MKRFVALSVAALLSACTPAPKGDALAAPDHGPGFGEDWSVTFDLNSWGRPMAHWLVKGDGTAELWRASGMSDNFNDYVVEKFHARMDVTAMAKFVEVSDPLKEATRGEVKCETTVTDMPYGAIVWRSGNEEQRYSFNFGCTSQQANAVYDRLAKAQEVVQKLAQVDAEPYAIERIGRH